MIRVMAPHIRAVELKDMSILETLHANKVRTTALQERAVAIRMDQFAYQMDYVLSLKIILCCREVVLIQVGRRLVAPKPNVLVYGPHLRVYTSMDANSTLDANLIMCEATSGDVPADGDGGGLWYCGTQTESCADATASFGIQQGYFADFRNYSSTSHAVATSTKSVPASSSARVTSDAGSNAAATTGTQHTPEPSCSPHTGDLSGGAIAGVAIGSFCVGLIVSGVGIFVFRRRGGGKHEVVQTAMEGKDNAQQHWEGRSGIVEMSSADDRVRELPASRLSGAELQ